MANSGCLLDDCQADNALSPPRTALLEQLADLRRRLRTLENVERSLRRKYQRLRNIIANNVDGVIVVDQEGIIRFMNPAACGFIGRCERENLVGELFGIPLVDGESTEVDILSPYRPPRVAEMRVIEIEWEGQPAYLASLRDITARKQMEQALREKTDELEAVNAELSQYAYVVSHDLRAPLRAVRNYADFIREDLGEQLDADLKMYLDGLDTAVGEADAFVSDLLELSRLGRRNETFEIIDMGEFLHQQLALFDTRDDVEVVISEKWPKIEADVVLLEQIFRNLISNAIKFNCSEHKRVELGWRPLPSDLTSGENQAEGKMYEFFVRDNGIGIDPRYHERIFQIFERLHTREEYDGTGMGLAIVKKAVGKLQGKIWMTSSPGEGSTFFVVLPEKQAI
jgi:signal transduction histidine kinase